MTKLLEIIQASAVAFLILYAIYALRESWHDLRSSWANIGQQWRQLKLKEIANNSFIALVALGPGGYLICKVLDHFGLIQI